MRRPKFIAQQARHARGLLGRLVAAVMAQETFAQNRRAIDALDIRPRDHVLDVGCGHGRSLRELAARAIEGRIAGADPSELMADIAVARNCELVMAGRVDLVIAGADRLPYADESFDKVMCVHVIYFWQDLDAFREIARVMKPGGRLALVFRTDADRRAVGAFPADIYRFRPLADVVAGLRAAGLGVQTPEPATEPMLLIAAKHRAEAAAQ